MLIQVLNSELGLISAFFENVHSHTKPVTAVLLLHLLVHLDTLIPRIADHPVYYLKLPYLILSPLYTLHRLPDYYESLFLRGPTINPL